LTGQQIKKMNKITKNLAIGLLILSILISTTLSCKKEESLPINTQNFEEINEQKNVVIALVTVVVIIIRVTRGQWERETKPNGEVTERCSGFWGSCSVNIVIPPEGGNPEIPLSSRFYYEQEDYSFEGVLGTDIDGNIIIAMYNTPDNRDSYNSFFYGNNISISRPFIIDNPDVLKQLNVSEKIVVQGDYSVQNYSARGEEAKYIIIH
jgi:hypothetical protein